MDEAINFVKQSRLRGIFDETIKQQLTSSGWQTGDLEKLFSLVDAPVPNQPQTVKQQILTREENKPSFKIKKIVVFGIVFLILVALSFGGYFLYSNHKISEKPGSPQNAVLESNPSDEFTQIIVYQKTTEVNKIHFFDVAKKVDTFILEIPEGDPIIQTGKWSPDGRYIPIQVTYAASGDEQGFRSQVKLYLFDSESRNAKVIYSGNRNDNNRALGGTSFFFSQHWFDNETMVLNTYPTMQLMDLKGNYSEKPNLKFSKRKNFQMEYVTNYIGNSGWTETTTLGGQVYQTKSPGHIVGIVNNSLASIQGQEGVDLSPALSGDTSNEEYNQLEDQIEALRSQNLSEEELQAQLIKLLEPKGETLLRLIKLDGTKSESTITLTDGSWNVKSLLVHPSEMSLVMHQTDNYFQPTKEKFVLVTPGSNKVETIYESDLAKGQTSNYESLLLYEGASFSLSTDGNWLIVTEGSETDSPETSRIVLINIQAKEKTIVCGSQCSYPKVHYPLKFSSVY